MTFTDSETVLSLPGNSESTHETPLLSVRSFGMTDRGLVQDSNEDQFLIAELTKALRIQASSLPRQRPSGRMTRAISSCSPTGSAALRPENRPVLSR